MSALIRPIAAIGAATIVVELLMTITDMGPNVWLVAALSVLVGSVGWFIAGLMNETTASAPIPVGLATTPTTRNDRRVMRLRSGLTYAQRDDAGLDQLRSGLVELVDDQLRNAHHIDRVADPDAARAVLGDELFAFVDGSAPVRRLAQPRTLDRVLTLIEQI